jgi:uncharacterized phage protein gp47/JayE
MTFGITSDGFSAKSIDDILDEIEADEKTAFGNQINTGADSVFGNLNGTIAEQILELWELAQSVYTSWDPDQAGGQSLDALSAITGTTREPATKSTVTLTVTLDPGTQLLVGRIVSDDIGNRFVTTEIAENTAGSSGDFPVDAEAEEYGPVFVAAGELTTIVTPVAGWTATTNAQDADGGTDLESDAELRQRREEQLRAQGEATVEAILADIREVEGVDEAVVYENVSDFVDSAGRPPHSVEVIILGDDPDTALDDRVGQALFETKAAGIETHREVGAQGRTITVTDSQGIDHDINFNRADPVEIYIEIDINVVSAEYAGDDAVKEALVAQGADYGIGDDVIAQANKAAAFDVSGVYDITDYDIGTAPSPSGEANIVIDIREISDFDTSRITVNSTPVTPS